MNVQSWHGQITVKVLAKIIFLVRAKVDLEIEGQEGAQANFNIAL